MLNVLAVTRFIINPAARFVARAASRMIFTGPLGSIGNIFMAQGYSFLLHSPTNLGRTKITLSKHTDNSKTNHCVITFQCVGLNVPFMEAFGRFNGHDARSQ